MTVLAFNATLTSKDFVSIFLKSRTLVKPNLVFGQVLQESYMMIPDSKGRLAKVLEDLEGFLGEHAATEGLPEDLLEQARSFVSC